ncbi:MAG: DUF433 domain-containing protein [Acidobacteria bacterium]|nr:DUF433 domain-containing protein [Acidobacteriota bacterium]
MAKQFVTIVDGAYKLTGARVSLDSVVYQHNQGVSVEGIVENFPALSREQVCGALKYYESHKRQVDEYIASAEAEYERKRAISRLERPELYAKLERARQGTPTRGA